MALSIPPGFLDLTSLANGPFGAPVNTIGVVVDFLPATKTSGTDCTIKFTLHDNTWSQGIGLTVRFFQKQENQLPKIQSQGDVVILRNVKLKDYHGVHTLLSNSTSSWVVIDNASLQNSREPDGSDVVVHQSGTANHRAARPNEAEMKYARALLELEDPFRWQQPARPTALQVAEIQRAAGGTPVPLPDKFRKVEELRGPQHRNEKVYVDLFAEVRRTYSPDHNPPRVELSVTDYTEHSLLYQYSPEPEDPNAEFEGDRFRYIENTHKPWPGPWGKKTLLAILWQPHRDFALNNVEAGSFVLLKNLQITFDRNGTKLEGHLRTDRFYESRVNVSVHKPRDAEGDERFTALLQRKRAYEEHCKRKQLRFMRDPKMPIKQTELKRKDASGPNDNDTNSKTKRNRDKKRRRRDKANAEKTAPTEGDDGEDNDAKSAAEEPDWRTLSANAHVRCNLDDGDSDSDVNMSDADDASPQLPATGTSGDSGLRWQWRFMLLVEDARPAPPPKKTSAEVAEDEEGLPKQMELLVSDSDADYLLRDIEACDLRKNPKTVARLREKLFVLWGDLQERKEEITKNVCGKAAGGEMGGKVRASARPFECFIKEYGIPSIERAGEWERMFRLCYTCI